MYIQLSYFKLYRLSPRDRAELSSSSLGSYRPPTTSLDNLIDKEINTGTYSAPLIGCIPPSALKCFAEGGTKEEGKGKEGSPMHSPSHSQSGMFVVFSGGLMSA